jgi:hypothetical protein
MAAPRQPQRSSTAASVASTQAEMALRQQCGAGRCQARMLHRPQRPAALAASLQGRARCGLGGQTGSLGVPGAGQPAARTYRSSRSHSRNRAQACPLLHGLLSAAQLAPSAARLLLRLRLATPQRRRFTTAQEGMRLRPAGLGPGAHQCISSCTATATPSWCKQLQLGQSAMEVPGRSSSALLR